jgi:hypothetical protein
MRATLPLHFVIIDAWHPGMVQRELRLGHLPALQTLLRHGQLASECASIFPSVTPACLTSLATGHAPDQHGITGVLWYHRLMDRHVHYWPCPQSLYWRTLDRVIQDFFLRLNGEHLSTNIETIFEILEAHGIDCASINFPVSRASTQHPAEIPWLMRRLGKLPKELMLPGPRHMRHGDLIRHGAKPKHFFGRYGFSDHQGAVYTAELIRQRERPKFMLTYLNENDLRSHAVGPENTGWSLRKVDQELGLMMDAYGSWERAAQEARWILVGDHSQSNTYPGRAGHAINVFKAFPYHKVTPLRTGGLQRLDHDFAVSPNDRMCYFHFNEARPAIRDQVLEIISEWPAVDQIFWVEGDTFFGWRVETGESLRFRRGGSLSDPYGDDWSVDGSLGTVGATQLGNRIVYRDYPNALARVAQALSAPDGGTMVMTAKLGYEFTSGFPMGRGNHGSLHREDSLVPLLTTGIAPGALNPRITDIVPMILKAFGVPLPAGLRVPLSASAL